MTTTSMRGSWKEREVDYETLRSFCTAGATAMFDAMMASLGDKPLEVMVMSGMASAFDTGITIGYLMSEQSRKGKKK